MEIHVLEDKAAAGHAAAEVGAERIRSALAARHRAVIVLATGASQFEMLDRLVRAESMDWGRVTAFHLDEYAGLSPDHPASFRRYLRERFKERLPAPLAAFHAIQGDAPDPQAECVRLEGLFSNVTPDVVFLGIGENGHLAFNDPPADFETGAAFRVVTLDEACRRQQVGEGWFPSLEAVPERAVTMTVPAILRGRTLVCTVPEARKAEAVRNALEGPVCPEVPASILQRHPDCRLFLDRASAAGLSKGRGGAP